MNPPVPFLPDSPIAKFLAWWRLDAACGHFLQALTPDTRLTVMLRFYPGHSTRNIIGVFRAYATDVASTSDLWHDKDLLAARVKKVRRIPAGNQQWGAFLRLASYVP